MQIRFWLPAGPEEVDCDIGMQQMCVKATPWRAGTARRAGKAQPNAATPSSPAYFIGVASPERRYNFFFELIKARIGSSFMNTVLPCGCLSEYTRLIIAVKHLNVLCSTFENVKMLKKKCQAKYSNSVICFVHCKYLTGRKKKSSAPDPVWGFQKWDASINPCREVTEWLHVNWGFLLVLSPKVLADCTENY